MLTQIHALVTPCAGTEGTGHGPTPKPDSTEPTEVFLSNTTHISNSAVSLERVDLDKVTALRALLLL